MSTPADSSQRHNTVLARGRRVRRASARLGVHALTETFSCSRIAVGERVVEQAQRGADAAGDGGGGVVW
jgi:hypothetical protein